MRLNLKNCTIALGIAMCALVATPRQASALVFINFDQDTVNVGNFGVITDLGGGDFAGSGITFNVITLQDTSLGTLRKVYCGADTLADSCLLSFNTATDTLTLVAPGGLTKNKVTPIPGSTAGMVVLTATSALGVSFGSGVPFVGFNTLGLTGNDVKAAELLDYFGVFATAMGFGNTNVYEAATGKITNSDMSNFGDFSLVPEPGMLTLFGLGLLGIGRRFRGRRESK